MCDFVNPPLIVSNLSIVQARCVTYGLAADPNAIYLLQVTNNKGVLHNPWFQFPVNVQYNVRAPAYDGSYYSGSLTGANNTDAWTWTGMIENMWNKASTLLGTYPGLPFTPNGAPEGFIFVGVSLLEALTNVLNYLGMTISGSYPSLTIVNAGSADTAYEALVTKYSKYLEDSMEYLDTGSKAGSGRIPKEVIVYFHRRNTVYGTEETVRYNTPQWQNTPAYSVTVTAPATYSSAVGTGHIWSDYTVRHDQNGDPLAADVTQATAIARERADQYFNVIDQGTQGFMRNTYAGLLPFISGSLVDGVRWFNTGKLGSLDDKWSGWRTEIIRGCIWEEIKAPFTVYKI